ncbi:MAG: hypoxanthine phosphoribosyltransferase [Balneolaceae bacterium]
MVQHHSEFVHYNGERFRVYLTEEEIRKRVIELGETLSRDFRGKDPIFIGVLNGAFVFLSDLIRALTIPCEIDFIKLSSYGDEKISSGQVTELKGIDADLRDRHVILVEDIVDTGLSLEYLTGRLNGSGFASLTTVTLLHKHEATKHEVLPDYVGFKLPNLFIIGYGLDFAQKGRNLPQIYIRDSG